MIIDYYSQGLQSRNVISRVLTAETFWFECFPEVLINNLINYLCYLFTQLNQVCVPWLSPHQAMLTLPNKSMFFQMQGNPIPKNVINNFPTCKDHLLIIYWIIPIAFHKQKNNVCPSPAFLGPRLWCNKKQRFLSRPH